MSREFLCLHCNHVNPKVWKLSIKFGIKPTLCRKVSEKKLFSHTFRNTYISFPRHQSYNAKQVKFISKGNLRSNRIGIPLATGIEKKSFLMNFILENHKYIDDRDGQRLANTGCAAERLANSRCGKYVKLDLS